MHGADAALEVDPSIGPEGQAIVLGYYIRSTRHNRTNHRFNPRSGWIKILHVRGGDSQ